MLSCSIPFNPIYHITIDGRVINTKTGRELKQQVSKGYQRLMLCNKGVERMFTLHRLLGEAFLPRSCEFSAITIDHIDRNKSNNNLSNLRLADTKTQNQNRIQIGKSGHQYIRQQGNYYEVYFTKNQKYCFSKRFKNLEDAIKCRDEYLTKFRTANSV